MSEPKVISQLSTIEAFTAFVKGGAEKDLNDYMRAYDGKLRFRLRDLYFTLDKTDEVTSAVKGLLTALHIPDNAIAYYVGAGYSLHQLLIVLRRDYDLTTDAHLSYLIKLIDAKERFITAVFVLNLLIGGLSLVASFTLFPKFFEAFKYLFNAAGGLPFWGLIYTVGSTLHSLYTNAKSTRMTRFEKILENTFLASNSLLNIAAYGVWITMKTMMPPLAAVLFVAASAVNVVKEIAYAVGSYFRYKDATATANSTSVADRQQEVLLKFGYKRHRNSAGINLMASVLLVGLMAAWCFIPGGALFVAGIIASIFLVNYVKGKLNDRNDRNIRSALSEAFASIGTEAPEAVKALDSTPTMLSKLINDKHPSPATPGAEVNESVAGTTPLSSSPKPEVNESAVITPASSSPKPAVNSSSLFVSDTPDESEKKKSQPQSLITDLDNFSQHE